MKYCNVTTYQIEKPKPIEHMEHLFINYDVVCDIVCEKYGLTRFEIKGRARKRFISTPRQIAMELCLLFVPHATTKSTGAYFGKDHSTVIYTKSMVHDLCDVDKKYREKYLSVRLKLEDIKAEIKRIAA